MARWEKRLADMRTNPRGWRYDQVVSILTPVGFEPPRKPSGSHRAFRHPNGRYVGLVDSGSGTLKPVYVEKAVEAVDEILAEQRGKEGAK